MEIRLDGKRALVTGGSSGIGAAIARELGAAGARTVVNFRSHPEAADQIVAQIRDAGGEAIAVQADVTDTAAVEAMFRRVDDEWGGIDILVNCAGIDGERASSWKIDPQAWQKVIATNLGGTFLCSQLALERPATDDGSGDKDSSEPDR